MEKDPKYRDAATMARMFKDCGSMDDALDLKGSTRNWHSGASKPNTTALGLIAGYVAKIKKQAKEARKAEKLAKIAEAKRLAAEQAAQEIEREPEFNLGSLAARRDFIEAEAKKMFESPLPEPLPEPPSEPDPEQEPEPDPEPEPIPEPIPGDIVVLMAIIPIGKEPQLRHIVEKMMGGVLDLPPNT